MSVKRLSALFFAVNTEWKVARQEYASINNFHG